MDLISPNLKLPYLAPAQAQKHLTHNEALRQLDAIVQLSVSSIIDSPPASPENGLRVIIGSAPEEVFAGKENHIAAFQDGAWAYYAPQIGWRSYVETHSNLYIYDGLAWSSVTAQEAIEGASVFGVNAGADLTNRLVVKSPASLFDHDGAGHQLKLNKSADNQTASLLFQTQYNSKAEIGLTGDDKLHLKVSSDGGTFKESLIVSPDTGNVSFPHGTH